MNEKKGYQVFIEQITGIFLPVISIITAASLMKSLVVLMESLGVIAAEGGIYRIFYAMGDGFFYFLPFFLAVTAAKQWKADPYVALLIPVTMLYPDLVKVVENEAGFGLFGLTVQPAVYHSSVLPVLMAVGLLALVEKPCDRFIPEAIRGFLKPMLCCAIVLPVTFLLFGPIGSWIGEFLTNIFFRLYDWSPMAAGAFMGFAIQPMVVVGAHWAIVPVCINNIATMGYDVILPLLGAAVYGQAGAALAVALRAKEKQEKIVAYQASFTAAIGTTEPALFGVTVPRVKPLLCGCVAGAVGGAMVGTAGTHCSAFAFPSFITSIAYTGPGFAVFLLSMVVGAVVGFVLTMLVQKERKEKQHGSEDNKEDIH